VVDPSGRIAALIPLRPVEPETAHRYPPETRIVDVRLSRNTATEPTVYARLGWLFPYGCGAAVLGAGAFALLARGRERRA
jgi:hypothetical protein